MYANKKLDCVPIHNQVISYNLTFKKKVLCFVHGKSSHHATKCRKRVTTVTYQKLIWFKASILLLLISIANFVADIKEWVANIGDKGHICVKKDAFTFYTPLRDGEEHVLILVILKQLMSLAKEKFFSNPDLARP